MQSVLKKRGGNSKTLLCQILDTFCCWEIIDGHLMQTRALQIFSLVMLIEWSFHLTPRARGALDIVQLFKYIVV